ncbi:MAG: phage tail assembly protein [Desulfovibrio sp.]|jgi:hypothetical protein|nr:phage tail assembly protein [Desulfovibrio sp.]
MSNPKTQRVLVKFDHPVQLADKVLDEVSMRRMLVGDVIDHPLDGINDVKGEARLIAALCGVNPEDIRLLDFADYGKLQDVLLSFRGISRA